MRVQRELRVRDFNGKFNRVCLIRPNRYRYYKGVIKQPYHCSIVRLTSRIPSV